jgi:hypothetical protein
MDSKASAPKTPSLPCLLACQKLFFLLMFTHSHESLPLDSTWSSDGRTIQLLLLHTSRISNSTTEGDPICTLHPFQFFPLFLAIGLPVHTKRSFSAFSSVENAPEPVRDLAISISTEDPVTEPSNVGRLLCSSRRPYNWALRCKGFFFFQHTNSPPMSFAAGHQNFRHSPRWTLNQAPSRPLFLKKSLLFYVVFLW